MLPMCRERTVIPLALATSLMALGASCGTSNGARTADAAAPANAPTPYTAEQLQLATPQGRTSVFRVESTGKPVVLRSMRFIAVSPENAVILSGAQDESGNTVEELETTTSRWEELRDHALFPRQATTITQGSVVVPAGTYDCMIYTVTQGQQQRVFHFARDLPGPPVKMEVKEDGVTTMTMTLLSNAVLPE